MSQKGMKESLKKADKQIKSGDLIHMDDLYADL
jgi:hypothetical protein